MLSGAAAGRRVHLIVLRVLGAFTWRCHSAALRLEVTPRIYPNPDPKPKPKPNPNPKPNPKGAARAAQHTRRRTAPAAALARGDAGLPGDTREI